MLLVHRNGVGDLEAALECRVVDEHGHLDPFGDYVWVEQLEVNPHSDARPHIHRFIEEIALLVPQAKWGYWERRDKPGQQLHCFSRTQLVKGGMRYASV